MVLLTCYTGKPETGEKIVAPLKSFGHPIADILIRPTYAQMQSLLDGAQPKGRRCYWKSEYLSHIEPELCEKVITHAARIPSPHSVLLLFQIGGALNRLDEAHSPAANRDARYLVTMAGAWEQPDEDSVNVEWARRGWNDIRPFSTGGTYINVLTEDEGYERIEAALGKHIQRLAAVKAQ